MRPLTSWSGGSALAEPLAEQGAHGVGICAGKDDGSPLAEQQQHGLARTADVGVEAAESAGAEEAPVAHEAAAAHQPPAQVGPGHPLHSLDVGEGCPLLPYYAVYHHGIVGDDDGHGRLCVQAHQPVEGGDGQPERGKGEPQGHGAQEEQGRRVWSR